MLTLLVDNDTLDDNGYLIFVCDPMLVVCYLTDRDVWLWKFQRYEYICINISKVGFRFRNGENAGFQYSHFVGIYSSKCGLFFKRTTFGNQIITKKKKF